MTHDAIDPEDNMTDTPSLKTALASITNLEAFEDALRRRTEGITWMVWGLVFAGLTVSFYAGELTPRTSDAPQPWTLVFPWLPWMLAGGVVTAAVWKAAQLHAPALRRPWWVTIGGLVVAGAATVLVFLASWAIPEPARVVITPLTIFGLAAIVVVSTPLLRLSAAGRRAALAAGAVQVACGIAMGVAGFGPDAVGYATTAGIVATTWIGAGVWETMQG